MAQRDSASLVKARLSVGLLVVFSSLLLGAAPSAWAAKGLDVSSSQGKARPWRVGMLRVTTDARHIVKRPLVAVLEAMRLQPNLDLLVGPEWLFVPRHFVHTAAEFQAIQKTIERASVGSKTLIAPGTIVWKEQRIYRNSLLAIANGETLHIHDKGSAGGDASLARAGKATWRPGNAPEIFHWEHQGRVYRVGLEICADHMSRSLFNATREYDPVRPVDLHILASSGAGALRRDIALAIDPGGLFVSNNGFQQPVLDVRKFHAEKPVANKAALFPGLSQIDEYTGWHTKQIKWKKGREAKTIELTDEASLRIFSVPSPTPAM